jgi:hypothetical protein
VDEDQRRKVLVGAAALARAVQVDVDTHHNEVTRVSVCGAPIFTRDEYGAPRVLGIRFPRWLRGPRKDV